MALSPAHPRVTHARAGGRGGADQVGGQGVGALQHPLQRADLWLHRHPVRRVWPQTLSRGAGVHVFKEGTGGQELTHPRRTLIPQASGRQVQGGEHRGGWGARHARHPAGKRGGGGGGGPETGGRTELAVVGRVPCQNPTTLHVSHARSHPPGRPMVVAATVTHRMVAAMS